MFSGKIQLSRTNTLAASSHPESSDLKQQVRNSPPHPAHSGLHICTGRASIRAPWESTGQGGVVSEALSCPGQTTLQGTMTPMGHCMGLRVATTPSLLRMASPPMVVRSRAIPPPLTPLVQMPLCTQGSQGAILLALTQDNLNLVGIQDQATPPNLRCPQSSRQQYPQMCLTPVMSLQQLAATGTA